MMTVGRLIVVAVVLAVLGIADAVAHRIFSNAENEQNEEARKKLLEKEERDIELDGNE